MIKHELLGNLIFRQNWDRTRYFMIFRDILPTHLAGNWETIQNPSKLLMQLPWVSYATYLVAEWVDHKWATPTGMWDVNMI